MFQKASYRVKEKEMQIWPLTSTYASVSKHSLTPVNTFFLPYHPFTSLCHDSMRRQLTFFIHIAEAVSSESSFLGILSISSMEDAWHVF